MTLPRGAVIEIVEKSLYADTPTDEAVVPNEVRINGTPVLVDKDHPVVVHEVTTRADRAVYVTLTLLASRVSIHTEHDPDGPSLGDGEVDA